MTLETEHRGFKITFAENQEIWRCWDLDFEHPSLSKLKQKIDQHERKSRKKAELVPVFHFPYSGGPQLAWVSSVDAANTNRYSGDKCWIIVEPKGQNKKEREHVEINTLAPQTPEIRSAVDEYIRLIQSARDAETARKGAYAAIPKFSREELLAAGVNLDSAE